MFNLVMMVFFQDVLVGKNIRGPFPSSQSTTNDIIQLIHFDLCGPMPLHSLGVHLYYIIFIDDFSRKTWIFYLKHKNEAFDMFKDLKALIENNKWKRIKFFRVENGGEYA